MGTAEATQVAFAGMAALVALGQLALTVFSGTRVEHVRAQQMANLATTISATEQDPRDPGVLPDLRAELRIATMQYRIARLTQTSLRLWGLYWLVLLGAAVIVYLAVTTSTGPVTTSSISEPATVLIVVVASLFLHFMAAHTTRRRQRPAIDTVDPAYLMVYPPRAEGAGTDGVSSWLPAWLARELWQEDLRARHDLRRRRLQPRLAFWSIRFTSVVTGLISGALLSYLVSAALHRIDPPVAKHLLLDDRVVEVIATSTRDVAVLSVIAPTWLVLVVWLTWLIVERPWNIRPKEPAKQDTPGGGAAPSPAWMALGLVGSLLGRSARQDRSATTP